MFQECRKAASPCRLANPGPACARTSARDSRVGLLVLDHQNNLRLRVHAFALRRRNPVHEQSQSFSCIVQAPTCVHAGSATAPPEARLLRRAAATLDKVVLLSSGGPSYVIPCVPVTPVAALDAAGLHVLWAPADARQLTLQRPRDADDIHLSRQRETLVRLPLGDLLS